MTKMTPWPVRSRCTLDQELGPEQSLHEVILKTKVQNWTYIIKVHKVEVDQPQPQAHIQVSHLTLRRLQLSVLHQMDHSGALMVAWLFSISLK